MATLVMGYEASRRHFAAAAAKYCSWRTTLPYGASRALAVSLAYKGAEDAPRIEDAQALTVVISGTHGIEGPAGGYVQIRLLNEGALADLPSKSGVLFVHALNPWGWANGRRVDVDNVDVNRSCGPLFETASAYADFADVFEPKVWNADAASLLAARCSAPGAFAQVKNALSGGQYHSVQGPFYGGTTLSRSAEMLRDHIFPLLARADAIGVIDIHSGLGEDGVGTVISPARGADGGLARRTRALFEGPFDFPLAQSAGGLSSPVSGDVLSFFARAFSGKSVLPIALEMGVQTTPAEALPLLIAENTIWHNQRGHDPGEIEAIRAAFREIFAPSSPTWPEALYTRARQIVLAMTSRLS